ncbi:MAG: hypothetical protein IJE41_03725 [Clostridia bacterium]|nr:hypothetical protein [Clostridia bacterium]
MHQRIRHPGSTEIRCSICNLGSLFH